MNFLQELYDAYISVEASGKFSVTSLLTVNKNHHYRQYAKCNTYSGSFLFIFRSFVQDNLFLSSTRIFLDNVAYDIHVNIVYFPYTQTINVTNHDQGTISTLTPGNGVDSLIFFATTHLFADPSLL